MRLDDGKGDAPTEFGAEETLFTGVETPACILSSRWDYAFVLFHKTFWADGWWWMDGLEGDAPTEFYKE